jgi:predicted Zn-dependent peptidase
MRCLLCAILFPLIDCARDATGVERMVLENGATVLLQPIEGIKQIGVEAFYDIGFMHEPKEMTQVSHLLEHLVCYGSSVSFRQQEAMDKLNALGMANAETLPARTHYDYMLPADQLALAIQIEKERLTSLTFDRPLIVKEAARVYSETDAVEANPASGMLKHAFMAFSQSWRHNANQALVRGGLEDMTVKELQAFHRDYYCPEKLTLVIVGDFQLEEAKKLLQDNLGTIKRSSRAAEAEIAWGDVPKRQKVAWDAKRSGVCLAFPPPKDRASSAAMSLFGTLLLQRLNSDPQIKQVANLAFCTNTTWPADPLPFFVYAAAKEGQSREDQSLEELERVLKTRFQAIVSGGKAQATQLPLLIGQLQSQATGLNRQMIDQQAKMLQRWRNMDKGRATGMVVTQAALNWGMMDDLLGPQPDETAARIEAMGGAELSELIDETLDEKKMIVTYVVPFE